MVPSREPRSPRPPQQQPHPSPAPPAASAASPPNDMPGPPMTSAEKSLFPNSMPVRQLPGIHSFSPSPGPPSTAAPGQAGSPPPPSSASAGAGSPPLQGRRVSVGADQKRFGGAAGSSFGGLPSLPGAGARSPPAATSPAAPASRPTPTPPILPPPAQSASTATSFRSPFASQAASSPAPSPQPAAAQQQQQKPSAPAAQSSTSGLLSRSNPMSVSSMLSGPPRAQPISAYSPTQSASTPTSSSAATPQPPVLPPDNRSAAATAGDHKPSTASRTQPGATLPVYASSLIAPTTAGSAKPKAAVEQPHQPGTAPASATTPTVTAASTAARSSYPPLPSAFARESPYSPAPASSAPTSGAGTPQHQHQHAHQQHQQHHQHPQHSQQQQQQASAAALKNSLFPNLGSYRPAGSPTQPPARAQQQQPTSSSTSTTASTPYQWQAQAAQQAQQVQQQQQAQRFGQQGGAGQSAQQGKGAQSTVPALGAAARPGQPLGQSAATAAAAAAKAPASQQYQNRFPPSLGAVDPHRMPAQAQAQQAASPVVPSPASATASPAVASSQSGFKRRRSDATEQSHQQPQHPSFQRAKPAPPASVVERAPVSPPEPPAPVNITPLFTYDEWRKAMVRPPVVEVLNDAVDAWAKKHGAGKADGKRKFLGRVTYDALTPPAELLDGATLAHNVGGYVEVVVPTSWVMGPHTSPSSSSASTKRDDDDLRSSCSVPPVDPHPVALSFGPPSAYTGAPLPLTSPTTPLVLPSHLADLPTVRQRQVWGTDVYADDSDVLLVLLHSGWLRVTRRDRRLRAGEKGAGADAVRRARTIGEERIAVPGRDGPSEEEKVPTALLVRLGVVPALVRYEGIERQGIRSRSWGNGHDGVSLRVEDVRSLDDVPPPRATRLRKPRAAACAHQIADAHRSAYPHLHDDHDDDFAPHSCPPPPPKRYRFSTGGEVDGSDGEGADEELVVTDTFVLELGEGRGRFVGLEDEDERGEDEEMGDGAAQAMEVEAA
ncbi:hypothetical protein JCM3775_007074 [Rhodotorula graminis]